MTIRDISTLTDDLLKNIDGYTVKEAKQIKIAAVTPVKKYNTTYTKLAGDLRKGADVLRTIPSSHDISYDDILSYVSLYN